jgi:hypothetical protein
MVGCAHFGQWRKRDFTSSPCRRCRGRRGWRGRSERALHVVVDAVHLLADRKKGAISVNHETDAKGDVTGSRRGRRFVSEFSFGLTCRHPCRGGYRAPWLSAVGNDACDLRPLFRRRMDCRSPSESHSFFGDRQGGSKPLPYNNRQGGSTSLCNRHGHIAVALRALPDLVCLRGRLQAGYSLALHCTGSSATFDSFGKVCFAGQ